MINIGIYKFTSPSGKIYIGQAINIDKRKNQYKNYIGNSSSIGPILLNSFNKYGYDKHQHEVIEECSLEQLDEREIYWKQHYIDLLGWKMMLFCELYDKGGGPKSQYTKNKMSITQQNHLLKPEILQKRLINCKESSTSESSKKRNQNINWDIRNEKLRKPKKVYVLFEKYDLNDNLMQTYTHISEILKEFNNPKPQNLYTCLKGTYKTWMGYKWKGYLNSSK